MLDFNLYNPTHIVFGQNRLAELDIMIPSESKVMITFGGSSAKKFGTIDKVRKALKSREVVEFGKIEPNPHFETLIEAAEIVKQEKVDFLLAVGGGSVMDGTKFIALAAKKAKEDYEGLLSHGLTPLPEKDAVPLGCIVTLPATGSEMNGNGAITHEGQKKVFIAPIAFPKFSFLDPDLTKTLPKRQVANGVVDSFVHTTEQYLTYPVGAKIQDRIAEGVLKTLIEDGIITYRDDQNITARKNLIWSATTALNGTVGCGVPNDWATHMISHELTAIYGIDHARALAVILPSLLRERRENKREKLLQYAERVWDIKEGSDEEKITKAIDMTEQFFQDLGMPTKLSDYDIDTDGIDKIINNLDKLGMTALSETGDLGLEAVRKILNMAK